MSITPPPPPPSLTPTPTYRHYYTSFNSLHVENDSPKIKAWGHSSSIHYPQSEPSTVPFWACQVHSYDELPCDVALAPDVLGATAMFPDARTLGQYVDMMASVRGWSFTFNKWNHTGQDTLISSFRKCTEQLLLCAECDNMLPKIPMETVYMVHVRLTCKGMRKGNQGTH